ncbi:MAG: hypothetical protein AVDCRST_MAG25-3265, partial [uncultured Rubrobacteraceae bacterium]
DPGEHSHRPRRVRTPHRMGHQARGCVQGRTLRPPAPGRGPEARRHRALRTPRDAAGPGRDDRPPLPRPRVRRPGAHERRGPRPGPARPRGTSLRAWEHARPEGPPLRLGLMV